MNVRLLFSAILAIAFVALLGPSSVSAAAPVVAPVVVYGNVDAAPSWHVPGVACGDAGAVDTVVRAPSGQDDRPANEEHGAPFGGPADDSDDDEATDCLGPVAFTYIPSSVITAAASPPHRCTSVIRKARGYADGMEHPPRS